MRIQHILNSMGEDDRGNFKTGSCGAVVCVYVCVCVCLLDNTSTPPLQALTETELDQIDELYKVVTPTRENNPE